MPVKIIDKDHGFKRLDFDIKRLRKRSVKIGFMGNEEAEGISVVDYAMFNEFGTDTIPARPFMATTVDRYSKRISMFVDKLVKQMIAGQIKPDPVLHNIGLAYQTVIRRTIREAKTWAVPNSPRTVAIKGSSSPLIDTGRMVQSVNYEVT